MDGGLSSRPADLYNSVGFSSDVKGLPELMRKIKGNPSLGGVDALLIHPLQINRPPKDSCGPNLSIGEARRALVAGRRVQKRKPIADAAPRARNV
eukprot:Skav225620  [mRNA]  locus=scaffold4894:121682:125172:- [translate_table: standard]